MRKLIGIIVFTALLAACSSTDCPLNNAVYATYNLYGSDGKRYTLKDTLTISTARHTEGDTILLNRKTGATTFSLPVSYADEADRLILEMRDSDNNVTTDTIVMSKTNRPHFESTDCSPSFFHTILGVKCTRNRIDSITINNREIDNDATKEHIRIYFRSGNQPATAAHNG
ncbi:MAG: DUF6452 family protein [Prevotella sp.]|uniref:DUF6452 family protein n=1 Tax=Prevotella sp. TaxID=59823 RepID=UPI002A353722|nr:DUF6452 family protein [Prevotella sp.]MDD7318740.1 DUF6452 family protein [Prevotellaceae bacterium]MDY4019304.1 DUF6452 family protein [Prevotella sp.]